MSNYSVVPCILIVLLSSLALAQQPIVQISDSNENLRGLSVPSRKVVWASGTHGSYVRTNNAGKTWTSAQVPGAESLDFRDVEAFTANLAYLLAAGPGEQSRVYKTRDGGKHWALQFTNHDPQGFLDCMAFWDRNHGIILGDPVGGKFTLLSTSDGGRHWTTLPNLPTAMEGEGAFAASGTCITVAPKNHVWFVTGGTAARVFHSSDRGQSWTVAEAPLPHTNASSGIFSIAFRDAAYGIIAGGDYKVPDQGGVNLAFTEDGGKTWQPTAVSPQAYYSAVATAPHSRPSSVIVVGTAQAAVSDDLRHKDWRSTWPLNLNSVAFGPDGSAWAVGPKGAIYRFPLSR